ncbi:choice-of-anchor Q domain-containing protein [Wenzhouxiangella marina]|uniref:Uncharacterized protein n=1 Tax=Wenzhouxiangella marina TaxID=1579979 RepID=A0A0K0XZ70_9GAMM|nr:choice-of-anchor Q domain-containing protein [Wenzhouxiangella marina]AKS42970.1 hypothetical protein WM2015_2612 [Wenzhouxiangella marina]MBB6087346.1 hypothetical protein [Wenzhouxiangella marina]
MSRKYSSSAKYEFKQSIQPKIAPLTTAVAGALAAGSLQAATITVTTLNDGNPDGGCELRSALAAASANIAFGDCPAGDDGADTIVFAGGLSGTIQLDAANAIAGFEYGADYSSLPIGDDVTIDGDNRITVRGTGNGRVFETKYDTDPSGFRAVDVTFSNITISNGGGETRGGGIYSRARYLTLSNTTLDTNAASISGGGLHHQPYFTGQDKVVQILNSTITGNFTTANAAGGGGGGVYANMSFGGLTLVASSNFSNNFATGGNGGGLNVLSQDYSSMILKYNTFSNNRAKYAGQGNGGAVFADVTYADPGSGDQVNLYDNVFDGNQAQGQGGGLYLIEEDANYQSAEILLTNNNFYMNEADSGGGGAFIEVTFGAGTLEEPRKSVTMEQNTFDSNVSNGPGGGLRLNLGELVTSTISESNVFSNTSQAGNGGGIYVDATDTRVYVSQSTFTGNRAQAGAGGGLQATLPGSSFGIEYSQFYSNRAESGCGGALRMSSTATEVGVGRSIFYENYASNCGGGISLFVPSLQNAVVEVKYNEITNNVAAGNGSVGGGGIFAELGTDTTLFLKNSTISGNQATGAVGGGVHFNGNMTAELKYATVANNTSNGDGGGVFNGAATCNISDTILAGNTGNATLYQDLRGSTYCEVTDSLVAGAKYSQFTNVSGNLLNINPQLGPLDNNGGPTFTHALLPGSPAIDAGTAGTFVPDTDQRGPGFPRVVGAGLDMGAYEVFSDSIFNDRFEQP